MVRASKSPKRKTRTSRTSRASKSPKRKTRTSRKTRASKSPKRKTKTQKKKRTKSPKKGRSKALKGGASLYSFDLTDNIGNFPAVVRSLKCGGVNGSNLNKN